MELMHHHFESIPSTNDWAKEHFSTFPKEKLTIVLADAQTAGRGQYGREWLSPSNKNLYASFCFFVSEEQKDALSITHVMAIIISKLLEEEGITPQIKWPNDVLVHGKKIAGILCETVPQENLTGVIVGVGMNINMEAQEFEKVGRPATSFSIEKQKSFDKEALIARLENQFEEALSLFLVKGFTPFLPTFRRFVFRS